MTFDKMNSVRHGAFQASHDNPEESMMKVSRGFVLGTKQGYGSSWKGNNVIALYDPLMVLPLGLVIAKK